MDWIARINQAASRLPLGDLGTARVSSWAYSPALPDNVPHRHAYYEVCLVGERGHGAYRVRNIWHPLSPATLFWARPGIMHQIRSEPGDPLELYWVSFQVEPRSAESDNAVTCFAQSTVWTRPAMQEALILWQSVRRLAEAPQTAWSQARQTALMTALILILVEAGSDPPPPAAPDALTDTRNDLASVAVRRIHDRLTHPPTVAELASDLGVSARHLSRLMIQLTGLAPARYIEVARLDRARFLLLRTDDPLKQIATHVGYGDVQQFTRAFSRCFGCPPGAFRASGGKASRRRLSPGEENVGALV